MLAIRLQRVGRKGTAAYRVITQDSRWSPKSGKLVAHLGHYDPHTKELSIDKEKVEFYLSHGAQPSDRLALLLKKEGVKLPKWVEIPKHKKRAPRKAAPEESPTEAKPTTEAESEAPTNDEAGSEQPAEQPAEPEDNTSEPATEAESKAEEAPTEAPSEPEQTA